MPYDDESGFLDLKQKIVDYVEDDLNLKLSPFEFRCLLSGISDKLYRKVPKKRAYELRPQYKNYTTASLVRVSGKLFTFLRLIFADKQGNLPRMDATIRDLEAHIYRHDRFKNYPQKQNAIFMGAHHTELPIWWLTQSAGLSVFKSTAVAVSSSNL